MSLEGDRASSGRPAPETAEELDELILRSVGWLGVSLGGRQLVNLLAVAFLAHLLEPEAFGLVAVAWIILGVLQEMQDSGIASALVYRRDGILEPYLPGFVHFTLNDDLVDPVLGIASFHESIGATGRAAEIYARLLEYDPELAAAREGLARTGGSASR